MIGNIDVWSFTRLRSLQDYIYMHKTYEKSSLFNRVTLDIKLGSNILVTPLVWYPCGETR